jgi:hypothetical protein
MSQFICKVDKEGNFVPLLSQHKERLERMIGHYSMTGKSVVITIEPVEKDISEAQQHLYKAFILSVADYFGVSFNEAVSYIEHLSPHDVKGNLNIDYTSWKHRELQTFIDKASAFLAEYGFKFN